jgi:hypothetical protein
LAALERGKDYFPAAESQALLAFCDSAAARPAGLALFDLVYIYFHCVS